MKKIKPENRTVEEIEISPLYPDTSFSTFPGSRNPTTSTVHPPITREREKVEEEENKGEISLFYWRRRHHSVYLHYLNDTVK